MMNKLIICGSLFLSLVLGQGIRYPSFSNARRGDKVPGCYVVAFRDSPVGNIKVANAQAAVRAQAAKLGKIQFDDLQK